MRRPFKEKAIRCRRRDRIRNNDLRDVEPGWPGGVGNGGVYSRRRARREI